MGRTLCPNGGSSSHSVASISMKAPITRSQRMDERLADAERRFAGVEEALASPEVLARILRS